MPHKPPSKWWRTWCHTCTRIHNLDHALMLPVTQYTAKVNTERKFAPLHHTVPTKIPSKTCTAKPLKPWCGEMSPKSILSFKKTENGCASNMPELESKLTKIRPKMKTGLPNTAARSKTAGAVKNGKIWFMPIRPIVVTISRSSCIEWAWTTSSDKFLPGIMKVKQKLLSNKLNSLTIIFFLSFHLFLCYSSLFFSLTLHSSPPSGLDFFLLCISLLSLYFGYFFFKIVHLIYFS